MGPYLGRAVIDLLEIMEVGTVFEDNYIIMLGLRKFFDVDTGGPRLGCLHRIITI